MIFRKSVGKVQVSFNLTLITGGSTLHEDQCTFMIFFLAVALRPNGGHGLLILDVSRSHTTTHYSRWDSSGRMISSS
jgi:hypothetical protein